MGELQAVGFVPKNPTYAIRIFSSYDKDHDKLVDNPNYSRIREYTFMT